MKVLEVNNIDLSGKAFNGFDLVNDLDSKKFNLQQLVVIKQSDSSKVKRLISPSMIEDFYKLESLENSVLSIRSMISITSPALFDSDEYKEQI